MRFGFDFSVGDVHYHVRVQQQWELVFYARTRNPMAFGLDERDNWDMPDFYYAFDTHGHCPCPTRVLRQVAGGLIPWMRKAQPAFLFFRCSERKKFRLYQRLLAQSRLNGLYDIQLIEQHAYLSLRQPRSASCSPAPPSQGCPRIPCAA